MAGESEAAWQFQNSVDCNAPRQLAWDYRTNIANWDDPPASFRLDGPFDAGPRLTTILPLQTLHSLIRHVSAGREAIIEMQLPPCDTFFSLEVRRSVRASNSNHAAAGFIRRKGEIIDPSG